MKIVTNHCYGGFGLSEQAIDAYMERKGKKVFRYKQDDFHGPFIRVNKAKKEGLNIFYHFSEDQGDSFDDEKKLGTTRLFF